MYRKHVIPVHLRSKMQQCSTGITATGPVEVVRAARRRKGVPQRRENGSPLQPGNAGNHRYRPCSNGQGRTPPQRCTLKAGKRFTFATGQCRKRRHRPCSNGHGRTPPQRCTLKAGKRFTFATGQCRERRYRCCGNGLERTPPQRCTLKAEKRFTFAEDLRTHGLIDLKT